MLGNREDVAVQMGTPWKTQRQAKKIISRSLNKFYIALNLTPKVLFFSKYITSQCHNIFAYKFHGSVIAFPFHIDIKRTLKSSWLLLDQTLPHCSAPHLLLWSLPTAPLGRSSPPATWRLFQCMEMWTCVRRMFSWVRRYRSSQTFCFPTFHWGFTSQVPQPACYWHPDSCE